MEYWKNKEDIVFNYQIQSIFSKLGEIKDNIPQLAHVDMKDVVTQFEEEKLGMKSCIGFTPINEDEMMLQVWTEGKSKKYCTVEKVIEEEKCVNDDNEPKPGQYVLYIPHGVMLVLPGDTVHVEVFVLAAKCHVQAKLVEKKFYCRMAICTFNFCCSQLARDDCNGEASITVVSNDEPPYLRDYAPEEINMKSLLQSVLDHHEDFTPIASYKKQSRHAKKKRKLGKVSTASKKK